MGVQLNHTIVWCADKVRSATFLADILGLPAPARFGPFQVIELENTVSLDFHETKDRIASQHYAFLIDDERFDAVFARIRARGLPYWADPGRSKASISQTLMSTRSKSLRAPTGAAEPFRNGYRRLAVHIQGAIRRRAWCSYARHLADKTC